MACDGAADGAGNASFSAATALLLSAHCSAPSLGPLLARGWPLLGADSPAVGPTASVTANVVTTHLQTARKQSATTPQLTTTTQAETSLRIRPHSALFGCGGERTAACGASQR